MKIGVLKTAFVLPILTGLVLSVYILVSQSMHGIGFPLDDAWIHQTYARNLGEWGEWAFTRGQVSAGSTAPLWTFVLALGYLFRIQPVFWSVLCGGMGLLGLAWTGVRFKELDFLAGVNFLWFGVFLIGEWHLVWSALSGMETILFAASILGVFLWMAHKGSHPIWVGCLVGLSIWIRPDGLTLLGPVLFFAATQELGIREKLRLIGRIGVGFFAVVIPYLIFNLAFAGAILPNTFFAKQAEYASLQQITFLQRWSSLLGLPLIGAGLVLAPGFLFAGYRFIRNRSVWGIAAMLWWVGFTALYAWRLPVGFQHGRYLIPAMPVFWLVGWIGSLDILGKLTRLGKVGRLVRFGGIAIGVGLWAVFMVTGARSYGEDVAIIETEMVETARWVSDHTPVDAVIGAHDIGALGYFGNRKLVDLAGLISPEVIPFIRDEQALLEHLLKNNATYLVTFSGWYPKICRELPIVYSSNGRFSPAAGGDNMTVYRLQK